MAGRKKVSTRKRRKRKLILFLVEIIILVILAAGIFLYHKLDLINNTPLDANKIGRNELSDESRKVYEGYTTIAMFGLDNRKQGIYTTGNSDVIMIMNIDNDTKKVNMISVYRDTYLNTAGSDESPAFRKANSAYAYGGPEQAITMLNRNLDLDIDDYVAFDFSAVANAIDILGGVDIEITSDPELKYLNEYIAHTNKVLGTDASSIDSVGTHTLNGVQAVAYSRIRYTKGGDYKRAMRQRIVFSQMVKKAKKAKLGQLNSLINEIFPQIQTSLGKNDIISMVAAMIGYDMADSSGFPFDRNTKTLGSKGSVVIPCDLESNNIKLHELLFPGEKYEPSDTVKEYNATIISDTGYTADSAEKDDFSEKDDFEGSGESGTGEDSQ